MADFQDVLDLSSIENLLVKISKTNELHLIKDICEVLSMEDFNKVDPEVLENVLENMSMSNNKKRAARVQSYLKERMLVQKYYNGLTNKLVA